MTTGTSSCAVAVAAVGEAWETGVLERLARPATRIVVHKRCVDLPDLLATANSGLVRVVLVSADLPGLDADSLAALRVAGVAAAVITPPPGGREVERWGGLGADAVLGPDDLHGVVEVVLDLARQQDSPEPDPQVRPSLPTGGSAGRWAGEDDPVTTVARTIAVWGPGGAPGRTTVAVGLAAELAASGAEVLLVDADCYGGAVAQHLGVLDEVSGVLAAVRAANAGRLDAAALARVARQVAPRLRVLTGLPRADRWSEVRATAFDRLLETTRLVGDYVVLDCGFSLEVAAPDAFAAPPVQRNHMSLAAVEAADELLVVGAADPVGLSRLARGLVELHERVPQGRPRVVVNRTRTSLGWGSHEIRGMVEGFVTPVGVHFLPEDRAGADRALVAGHSLVESGDSALRRGVAEVAAAVRGDAHRTSGRRRRLRRARRAHAPNSR